MFRNNSLCIFAPYFPKKQKLGTILIYIYKKIYLHSRIFCVFFKIFDDLKDFMPLLKLHIVTKTKCMIECIGRKVGDFYGYCIIIYGHVQRQDK